MYDWRIWPLSAYYHASLPYRWWRNRRWAQRGRAPVTVLFYHRVADTHPNPWTCSRRVFARQVAWLKHHFDLLTLEDAQHRLRSGLNRRPAVCITFDDGYAENCDFALPLLEREQVPCTYFVASDFVLRQRPFPHDVERGQPLPPNTLDQLRYWAERGVEVSAHTRTHADLGQITNEYDLVDEVVVAGEELQQALGHPVRYFAFPYGQRANLNPRVFHLAHAAGYEAVCSAYGGFNFPGDDAFHLQRVHGDPDLLRVKNWTTLDPRKLRVERYRYEQLPINDATPGAVSA